MFEKIVVSYCLEPGKGLPIGNLISQHLANFYLSVFDHWIKEERRVRGYLRYMDDFLLFGRDRERIFRDELPAICEFLHQRLSLTMKPEIQMNRSIKGIPFLGYRIYPWKILLAPRSKKRFINKFRTYESRWQKGEWTEERLVRHMEPLLAFARFAASKGFRNNVLSRFGVLS